MKKSILLLALVLVLSCSAFVVMADDGVAPVLKLSVTVNNASILNVTYTAQLIPAPTNGTQVPVITFICDGVAIAKVPVNNLGIAKYSFTQKAGKYQAVSIWENTITPIKSNIVDYVVL